MQAAQNFLIGRKVFFSIHKCLQSAGMMPLCSHRLLAQTVQGQLCITHQSPGATNSLSPSPASTQIQPALVQVIYKCLA